jgi:GT2 family glycosyltransferase
MSNSDKGGSPQVTVCTVHYDAPERLEALLESFSRYPPTVPCLISIADNSASRYSIRDRLAPFEQAQLYEMDTNLGFGAANNFLAEKAKSQYLFFLNPDTEIREGTLDRMVEFLELHPEIGILGPTNLSPSGEIQPSCRRFPSYRTALANRYSLLTRLFPDNTLSTGYLMTSLDRSKPQQVDWVSGAALFIRRRDFQELSGFDEAFWMYAEDVDLCYRLNTLGKKVFYFPQSEVVHQIGCSSRRNRFRTLWERHRSMYVFYRKHYSLDIPLIDFMTLLGISLRGMVFLGLEALGRSPHR